MAKAKKKAKASKSKARKRAQSATKAPPASDGFTKKDLIVELNKDLEYEYAAAIQYIQHAALITGPGYDAVAKELIVHANEETTHAVMVAEQIAYLGGTPSVDVEKIYTSKSTLQMLKQDLGGEQLAIDRYKERIRQAEQLQEYGLRRVIEDILIQEEEHKRDIMTVLGK